MRCSERIMLVPIEGFCDAPTMAMEVGLSSLSSFTKTFLINPTMANFVQRRE